MGRRDIELNIPPNPLLNPIRIVLPDQVVNDKNWPAGLLPVSKARNRAVGGGCKPTLKRMSEKLFFVLFYFKCYPTFDLAGLLFDVDRAQSNRWLHKLQPILEAALEQEMVLPERQIKSMAEVIERFPVVERVIIDGVDRPIQRPQDDVRQRRTYSGKKKRNTRKQIGGCDQNKRILVLTPMHDGKFQGQVSVGRLNSR